MTLGPESQSLTSPHVHRRDNSSVGIEGTTRTIIIVVSVIVGIVILFVLFRLLLRLRGRNSRPLPPIQPIASQREQQLAELTERHDPAMDWFRLSHLTEPHGFSPSASETTLPQVKQVRSGSSSEGTNPRPDSGKYLDIPRCRSPSPGRPDDLQMPSPSFGNKVRRDSGSSQGSTSSTPLSASLSSSWSRSVPRRPRPLSTVSTTSLRSSTNRSTIVGVPHGPHSHVKIVLPTPLAPALHPHVPGSSPVNGRGNSLVRSSVVDMWTPTFHQTGSSDQIGTDIEQLFERPGNSSSSSRLRTISLNRYNPSPQTYNTSPLATPRPPDYMLGEPPDCTTVGRGRSRTRSTRSIPSSQVSASHSLLPDSPFEQE